MVRISAILQFPSNVLLRLNVIFWQLSPEFYQDGLTVIGDLIRDEIAKHRATYDQENVRDLIDLFIQAEKNDFKDVEDMDGILTFLIFTNKQVAFLSMGLRVVDRY